MFIIVLVMFIIIITAQLTVYCLFLTQELYTCQAHKVFNFFITFLNYFL